jgi:hypothetical protein
MLESRKHVGRANALFSGAVVDVGVLGVCYAQLYTASMNMNKHSV